MQLQTLQAPKRDLITFINKFLKKRKL